MRPPVGHAGGEVEDRDVMPATSPPDAAHARRPFSLIATVRIEPAGTANARSPRRPRRPSSAVPRQPAEGAATQVRRTRSRRPRSRWSPSSSHQLGRGHGRPAVLTAPRRRARHRARSRCRSRSLRHRRPRRPRRTPTGAPIARGGSAGRQKDGARALKRPSCSAATPSPEKRGAVQAAVGPRRGRRRERSRAGCRRARRPRGRPGRTSRSPSSISSSGRSFAEASTAPVRRETTKKRSIRP